MRDKGVGLELVGRVPDQDMRYALQQLREEAPTTEHEEVGNVCDL